MEILNLRKTKNGFLINGLVETVLNDANYADALKWEADGKEVMPQHLELDIFTSLQTEKIALIDSTTAQAIEALVGDNNKQKDKLAESILLARLENAGTATTAQVTRLDALQDLSLQVATLKARGNDREAQVSALALADFTTLADAVAAVEAI